MMKINITCIATYPPKQCGIATFTKNFIDSVCFNDKKNDTSAEVSVVAIDEKDSLLKYPETVVHRINKHDQRDYIKAADFINYSDSDLCFLQHEFGLYGGDSGIFILPLLYRLEKPLVVIFHTVLKNPSYNERAIVCEIGKQANKIVVMSQKAVKFLKEIYEIPKEKITYIQHGVPDFNFLNREQYKKNLNIDGKKILLTFGLLSRNKGIETVINALPQIVEKHPDVLYIVLGKTHPGVLRVSGEEYRNYLKLLVREKNLNQHVYFDDRFVSREELLSYLSAIDIYITPYLNEAQITSGTLSYAVGAGAVTVSTPYWHAQELLADDRGILFDFNDSNNLAEKINQLLENPQTLQMLRTNAYKYGREILWPHIGKKYRQLCDQVTNDLSSQNALKNEVSPINPLLLPELDFSHIKRLSDSTGILQHAKYNMANFHEGYCLDDNARALLMCLMAYRQKKDKTALELIPTYLSYIHYMQNEDGSFRNFLSYSRSFLDEKGSEDSFGRTIWALGYLICNPPGEIYFQFGSEIFNKARLQFKELKFLRGIANTIIGICYFLQRFPDNEGMNKCLNEMTDKIVHMFEQERRDDWLWFEPLLSYDNGIIPLALFHSYKITGDERILKIALETTDFLEKMTFKGSYISLIGSDNWYQRDGSSAQYAQQPINATAKIMMFYQAFAITGDKTYLEKMFETFMWYLGENDLRIPLYDFETHGCNDGLESHGVNRNQGAESTIAYHLGYLSILAAFEEARIGQRAL